MGIITAVAALLAGLGNVGAVLAAGGTVTLGTFLVPAGIAAVGGFILQRLMPRVDPQGQDAVGATARTVRGSIVPQRWVVGRARVAGVLVWLHESGRNLDLIYVLGAGPMDAVEEIWINGLPTGATFDGNFDDGAVGTITQSRYAGSTGSPVFRFYLSGRTPQNTPQAVRDFSMASPRPWTSAHQLLGLAWVHVRLHQPDYGTNINNRVWTQLPELNFLVRGLKFADPRAPLAQGIVPVARWTQNAAAIRWWWLVARRGIPADEIDPDYYSAAYDVCDEFLRLDGLEGYTTDYLPNFHRYSINGVIVSGDRPEFVEANMDAAWAGNVVEFDGIHRFLPGVDRPAVAALNGDDIVEAPTFRPAPEHHERVNQLSARISQSIYHDYSEYGLAAVDDTIAQERDGETLTADLGTLNYVNDPVQGFSLLAKQLRRERAVAQIDLVVRPGDAFENVTLAPGDIVTLTLPEWELDGVRHLVLASEVDEDWRVRLSLLESPDGIYEDTLQLPPIGTRSFVPATPPDNVPILGTVVLTTALEEPGSANRDITEQPPSDPIIIRWSWPLVEAAEGYEYQFQRAGTDAQDGAWIGTTAREITRSAYTLGGDFAETDIGDWRFFVRPRAALFTTPAATTYDFSVVDAISPPSISIGVSESTFFSDGEEHRRYTAQVVFFDGNPEGGTHLEWRASGPPDYPGSYNFARRSWPSSGRLVIFTGQERQSRDRAVDDLDGRRYTFRAVDTGRTPEAFSPMRFTAFGTTAS